MKKLFAVCREPCTFLKVKLIKTPFQELLIIQKIFVITKKLNCLNKPLSMIGELRSLYCSCGLEFIIKCCGLCEFGLLACHPVGSNTAALTFLSCLPQPTYRDVNLTYVQYYSLFPWEEIKTTSVQFHCLIKKTMINNS